MSWDGYKTIKHIHQVGDLHELTFSCYEQRQLLACHEHSELFCRRLDRAGELCGVDLYAFVIMPEHVHLIVGGFQSEKDIENYLFALKQPYSRQVKALLKRAKSPLLTELTIRERPGKEVFRFWQEGPGYDRNLFSAEAILAAIDYLHRNPVRRELCIRATEWKWSSARQLILPTEPLDPDLPQLTRIARDYLE